MESLERDAVFVWRVVWGSAGSHKDFPAAATPGVSSTTTAARTWLTAAPGRWPGEDNSTADRRPLASRAWIVSTSWWPAAPFLTLTEGHPTRQTAQRPDIPSFRLTCSHKQVQTPSKDQCGKRWPRHIRNRHFYVSFF